MTTPNQTLTKILSRVFANSLARRIFSNSTKDNCPNANRSRQGNWRFLLPGLPPKQTVCFANSALTPTVKSISESIIDFKHVRADSCDLAVAKDPSQETIELAWSSLKEEGSCYFEYSRPIDPSAIALGVSRAGFEDVRLYLALPQDKSSVQTWIPLDSSSAIAHFLSFGVNSSNGFRRLILKIHEQAFQWFTPVFINFPWLIYPSRHKPIIVAIGRKPKQNISQLPLEHNLSLLERIFSYFDRQGICSRQVSILMKVEQTSTDQAILSVFIENKTTPQLLVKVALGDWEDMYFDREVELLKTLEQKFTRIPNIPKVVFEGRYGGYRTQAQTFISGIPLTKIINLRNFDVMADTITDWLILLAKQTKDDVLVNRSHSIENILADLAPSISTEDADILLATTARSLEDLNLPFQVVQHRDFGPWNIHIDKDNKIGVIDWAEAIINGVPGIDLIYFLTMLSLQVEQNKPFQLQVVYTRLLNPKTSRNVFNRCLERYLTELNISKSLIPQLRLLTWVIHTYLEPKDKRVASTFFSLWQEEIRQRRDRSLKSPNDEESRSVSSI